jgi:cytochrome c
LLLALLSLTVQGGEAGGTSTWDGVFTTEQAQRGENVYQLSCASCHGPQLDGIDAAPALNGGAFYANWNGISLKDMAERIKISMPQNDPGSLNRQQVVDVMAYVFSRNGFPAGERELPKRPAYLTNIYFQPSAD